MYPTQTFEYCRKDVRLQVCECGCDPDDRGARHVGHQIDQPFALDVRRLCGSTAQVYECTTGAYQADDLGDLVLVLDGNEIRRFFFNFLPVSHLPVFFGCPCL